MMKLRQCVLVPQVCLNEDCWNGRTGLITVEVLCVCVCVCVRTQLCVVTSECISKEMKRMCVQFKNSVRWQAA